MTYSPAKMFGDTFAASRPQTTVHAIPGELEGLFSWVTLNYARQPNDPFFGLAEMGGASTQFAFEDHSGRVANKARARLPSESGGFATHRHMLRFKLGT